VDAAGVVDFVYQYDADNRLTNRWTPARGNTAYTYDAVGNRTAILYPQSSVLYSYDALNRLKNMVDSLGTTVYGYDAAGQLLSAGGLWPNDAVSYTYTNRERATLNVGAWSQGYTYDTARRLTGLTSPAGAFGYGYGVGPSAPAASPLVRSIQLPNTASITNAYDPVARLTGTYLTRGTDHHVLDGYTYAYDLLGQRTNVLRDYGLMNSSASAGYDALGELASWTAQEANGAPRLNEQLGYGYDAAGNLLQRTNNALVQSFGLNSLNELTHIGRAGPLTVSGNTPMPASSVTVNGQPAQTYADFTFASSSGLALKDGLNAFTNLARNYYGTVAVTNALTVNLPRSVTLQYDANGNLTNDGERSFGCDSENQLTNVQVAGQWREDLLYDGLNRRRITRDYAWQSGTWVQTNEIRCVYDGHLVIQEWDANNNPQVTYTRGQDLSGSLQRAGGIGGLLARTDAKGSAFYHADGNGNVTALMDASQFMVARYLYDPFGRLLGSWGTLADANVYRFSSKEWDGNLGLYYYLYRFYDPYLQRWLNRDPIGERGGLNLYEYVYNDPVKYIDPNGLKKLTACDCQKFLEDQILQIGKEAGAENAAGFAREALTVLGAVAVAPIPGAGGCGAVGVLGLGTVYTIYKGFSDFDDRYAQTSNARRLYQKCMDQVTQPFDNKNNAF
jgi:RHS repeat-associated protein